MIGYTLQCLPVWCLFLIILLLDFIFYFFIFYRRSLILIPTSGQRKKKDQSSFTSLCTIGFDVRQHDTESLWKETFWLRVYLILSILKITSKTRRTQLLVCDLGERNSLSVLLRPLRQITWLCFPGASGNKRRVLLACIILTWQNLVIEKCWNASPKLYLDACKNNWDMSKRLSATKKKKKPRNDRNVSRQPAQHILQTCLWIFSLAS